MSDDVTIVIDDSIEVEVPVILTRQQADQIKEYLTEYSELLEIEHERQKEEDQELLDVALAEIAHLTDQLDGYTEEDTNG